MPIIFASAGDPVTSGLVARLDRPGGNITGFGILEASLGGKWLGTALGDRSRAQAGQKERPGSPSLRARAIPSPAPSSRGSTSRVGTSPASASWKPRLEASGLSCSRRSRSRAQAGRHHMFNPGRPRRIGLYASLETAARSFKDRANARLDKEHKENNVLCSLSVLERVRHVLP